MQDRWEAGCLEAACGSCSCRHASEMGGKTPRGRHGRMHASSSVSTRQAVTRVGRAGRLSPSGRWQTRPPCASWSRWLGSERRRPWSWRPKRCRSGRPWTSSGREELGSICGAASSECCATLDSCRRGGQRRVCRRDRKRTQFLTVAIGRARPSSATAASARRPEVRLDPSSSSSSSSSSYWL